MKGRFLASAAMAALGTTMLVAAMFAGTAAGGSAASDKAAAKGGTFRIVSLSDFDHIDPALSYFTHTWNLHNSAAQLRLFYYPLVAGARNQRIEPMAATGMPRISKNGRVYTIDIKPGFRFSNGTAVTNKAFTRSFSRAINKQLQSPAISFFDDVARWKAIGNYRIQITLKRVAPDFLARLTMPFFSAVLPTTPVNKEVDSGPLHSAGPYYVQEWTKKSSALVVRNPHWNNARAPFKALGFANNVDRITWRFGITQANQRLMCENNEADNCGFPSAQAKELADKYGVNKGRFFAQSDLLIWRIDMNGEQPLFRGNAKLRQAVSWAIDRRFMTAQHGFLGGRRTDQFLPYGMPGFREWNIYPTIKGPNYTKAKSLAQGNLRGGKAIFYAFNTAAGQAVAQSVQFNLKNIGLDVEIKTFDRVVQNTKAATRGEPFDMTMEGWHADYPDPSNFINVLLDGRRLQPENNVNTSYYNGHQAQMDRAFRASGAERLRLYGILDRDIMKDGAPSATYISGNVRHFVGPDVGCYTYAPQAGLVLLAVCKK